MSSSVITPTTGGYNDNVCNSGFELQVLSILSVDPRAIITMETDDMFSPAFHAIKSYLNNTKYNAKGRDSMASFFSTELSQKKIIGPLDLAKATLKPFNEVVICGNQYIDFFEFPQHIKILGIGLSEFWLDKRRSPSKEAIQALKELSSLVPIIYFAPNSATDYDDAFLLGKNVPTFIIEEKFFDLYGKGLIPESYDALKNDAYSRSSFFDKAIKLGDFSDSLLKIRR